MPVAPYWRQRGTLGASTFLISRGIRSCLVRVCGVDEAGRGPMFGPLVVAGVAIDSSKISRLRRLGLRDSKKLSPARREALYGEIIRVADRCSISRIQPATVDKSVQKHGLNRLEAQVMGRIIGRLGADTAYVDACDTNAARFGREVAGAAGIRRVHSHHRADERFVIVSAASIIAKVARDKAIARLGIDGSGYPSDPRTKRYLRRYVRRHHAPPKGVRLSWKPVKAALHI